MSDKEMIILGFAIALLVVVIIGMILTIGFGIKTMISSYREDDMNYKKHKEEWEYFKNLNKKEK